MIKVTHANVVRYLTCWLDCLTDKEHKKEKRKIERKRKTVLNSSQVASKSGGKKEKKSITDSTEVKEIPEESEASFQFGETS